MSYEKISFKFVLDRISKIDLFSFSKTIYIALYSFLMIFAILLFSILINGDYESILKISEFVIIGSGTLAILTFTYALAMERSETKEKIVCSGELLLKSTIAFLITLGLLPGVGYLIKTHTSISSFYGVFAKEYDSLLALVTAIILIFGMVGLISSVYFLTAGIKKLMEVFEMKT